MARSGDSPNYSFGCINHSDIRKLQECGDFFLESARGHIMSYAEIALQTLSQILPWILSCQLRRISD
jgi:hypothetical protein